MRGVLSAGAQGPAVFPTLTGAAIRHRAFQLTGRVADET
jgi:hypothetical protein